MRQNTIFMRGYHMSSNDEQNKEIKKNQKIESSLQEEANKNETGKNETGKNETGKNETGKNETGKKETDKKETNKIETDKKENDNAEDNDANEKKDIEVATDSGIDENKKVKRSKIWKIVRVALIVALVGVMVYEGIGIYTDQKEYEQAEEEYDEIEDSYVVFKGGVQEEASLPYPDFDINHNSLRIINDAYIGWLYFPAMDISYPVVKERYIDEFLRVTFDGKHNTAGSIFMDIASNEDFRGMSDFVFGHNMRNGSMFGSLKQLYLSDEDLLKSNDSVFVYTDEYIFQYKVFAYYNTRVGSDAYQLVETEEEYDEFLSFIKSHTAYKIPDDIDFSQYPSLLTLSTCSGKSGSGNRFVVHTVKVGAWKVTD
ncbi:MAG: sortase [Butyrivibrio sp.]|nr:sortase [Butyrivibrio sp.]